MGKQDVKVVKKQKVAEEKPKKTKAEGGVKKPRKVKKEKDPNAPKRATTAYFYYQQDHRARIKESLPAGSGVGDIAKAMGAEWKQLTPEEKAPYEERANNDKARYAKESAAYKAAPKPEEAEDIEEEEEADEDEDDE